jgi:hypothetical protein
MPTDIINTILERSLSDFYKEKQTFCNPRRFTNSTVLRREQVEANGMPFPLLFDESLSEMADFCLGSIFVTEARRVVLNSIAPVCNINILKKKGEGASWIKEEIKGHLYIIISLGKPYNGENRQVILRWKKLKFGTFAEGCVLANAANELEEEIAREIDKGNLQEKGRKWWKYGIRDIEISAIVDKWAKFPESIVQIEGCDALLQTARREMLRKLKDTPWKYRRDFAKDIMKRWVAINPIRTTRPLRGKGDLANGVAIRVRTGVWWIVGAIPMPLRVMQVSDHRVLSVCEVMVHVEHCMQLLYRWWDRPLDEASRGQLTRQLKQFFPVSGSQPLVLALEKSITEDTHYQSIKDILDAHRRKFIPTVFSELNAIKLM